MAVKSCQSDVITLTIALALCPIFSLAQVSSSTAQPAVQPQQLPITTQIKKTIVFLESDCIHDFAIDANNLPIDRLVQMPQGDQERILHQLTALSMRLKSVKPSMSKLSPEEAARLFPDPPAGVAPIVIPEQIEWMLQEIIKMTSLTDEDIAGLTQMDLANLPLDNHRGTGFLIGYLDPRLKPQPGDQGQRYFRYLVTNRHVVQPGIEKGTPCKVVSSYILLNRKPDPTHADTYTESDRTDKIFKWITPQDDSVDLAVTPIGFDEKQFDQTAIPTDRFVTAEEIKNRRIVEGDPVLFAGLFVQTFDQVHTLEPIVRSGAVAMIPEGVLQTTLNNKLGHIYLAEAHAFHGNSGSPMFVDPNKFAGVISTPTYKLLGVISGEMFENSDLTLTVASTLSGNIAANSDVSMIVPAPELMKLLDDPELKASRDRTIEAESIPSPEHPQ